MARMHVQLRICTFQMRQASCKIFERTRTEVFRVNGRIALPASKREISSRSEALTGNGPPAHAEAPRYGPASGSYLTRIVQSSVPKRTVDSGVRNS